jgi:hypothetical protein
MTSPRGYRKTARLTVSLDKQAHAKLSVLAKRQDVSIAWTLRRGVSEFIERQGDSHNWSCTFNGPGPAQGRKIVREGPNDDSL